MSNAERETRPAGLIPPPEAAPAPGANATHEECVAAWIDLLDATDAILLANLRSQYKTEEEVLAARRECYRRQSDEHSAAMCEMMRQLDLRMRKHGG